MPGARDRLHRGARLPHERRHLRRVQLRDEALRGHGRGRRGHARHVDGGHAGEDLGVPARVHPGHGRAEHHLCAGARHLTTLAGRIPS